MRILICNERFLFRFGVDRVLLILTKYLLEQGHYVSIMANKIDEKVIESLSCGYTVIPECPEYINGNEYTVQWLEENWKDAESEYDLALVAGWPFFSSIALFKSRNMKVVYNDYGIVPTEGYEGGHLQILKKLQNLKNTYVKESDIIVGISEFIALTQSLDSIKNKNKVTAILLGANHLHYKLWQERYVDNIHAIKRYKKTLDDKNCKTIFLTGRWEPHCYKNVEDSFEIVRELSKKTVNLKLFILAKRDDVIIPYDLEAIVEPVGFVSDEELEYIMREADLGLSVSLWEGFNLPLAEMQWLHKPILAYDVGAHAEVVCHPWFLCKDRKEMIDKAAAILENGTGIAPQILEQAQERFCQEFQWDDVCGKYENLFKKLVENTLDFHEFKPKLKNKYEVIIDVTNAMIDTANSGVVRVARRLARELQNYLNPIFVYWRNNAYYLAQDYSFLGSFNGPYNMNSGYDQDNVLLDRYLDGNKKIKWLFFTETLDEKSAKQIRIFARRSGIYILSVFYDAISVLHPEFCHASIVENHGKYMCGLALCDVVAPISDFSKQCLLEYWSNKEIKPTRVMTNQIPGEFAGRSRVFERAKLKQPIKILCVSTLEPRKNHKTLIQAFISLIENNPEIDATLTLVGNRYIDNDDIPNYVEDMQRKYKQIAWLGVVDDRTLTELYYDCSFTIYASVIEGFGMPILESLWHGKPCICYNEGVMNELALEGGGCLTVDVKDADAMCQAMARLSTNHDVYDALVSEAVSRKIKTWNEYARVFIKIIEEFNYEEKQSDSMQAKLNSILYNNCLAESCQMNNSEYLALKAVLMSLRSTCSIEIGTCGPDALSLVSQYSDIVFSINIDEEVEEKFSCLQNVVFLTGQSWKILPALFDELDRNGIVVDFILFAGDGSYDNVRRNIEIINNYKNKNNSQTLMLTYASSLSSCRRGLMDAIDKYGVYCDLDFIPGRIAEYDDENKKTSGGFGLIFFPGDRDNTSKSIIKSLNVTVNSI